MAQDPGALTGILDIEAPVAPLASGDTILAVTVSLLVLAVILYFTWRRFSSPHARARRKLKDLQRRFHQQQLDGRHCAFQLAAIVRDGVGVQHLSPDALPADLRAHETRWREFLAALTTARYAAEHIEAAQVGDLFRDARFWLRHWP